VASLALGTALGFAAGDARAAWIAALIFTLLLWSAWFALAFLPLGRTRKFWGARSESLLERTWFRAFDEVGLAAPPAPLFLVFSDPAPLFIAWCSGGGGQVLLISQAWLSSHSETAQREALRRAAVRFSEKGMRWRTAEAWFAALTFSRLPAGVRGALWESSGKPRSTVWAWVLALPWVAWILWVQRTLPTRETGTLHSGSTLDSDPLPLEPARRAAATLMSVEALPRSKTILSFSPTN
jgi:hypothetical protein